MRKLYRDRRSLTWLAGLAAASIVASVGATSVLAEEPTCVTSSGHQVSAAELASDPSLCPPSSGHSASATPAPAPDPAPATPPPAPAPAPAPDPAPVAPAPAPAPAPPSTPAPTPAPAPAADPAPATTTTDATTTTPAPETATPGTDATSTAGPTTDSTATGETATGTGTASGTTGGTSTTPTTPTNAAPTPTRTTSAAPPTTSTTGTTSSTGGTATPKPAGPTREAKPRAPRPSTSTDSAGSTTPAAHATAKTYQAPGFVDARTFRENFHPVDRIPEQPRMDAGQAKLLVDAAKASGLDWSLLAAVSWLESRWGDPTAGGFLGRRLDDAAWATYGTDGDGDGEVTRTSEADQAHTVANYLATVTPVDTRALELYFTGGTHSDVMAQRALFLADWFDALGSEAIVHGLDDADVRASLEERILANDDVEIYDGGRSDIQAGLIDPRILVSLEFLQRRFDTVTVSCLVTGHSVFTASGNVSLHAFGQAVDIAALDGEPIVGHQQKDGKTWHALHDLLLLPDSMQGSELISLWSMGGASFALPDHDDHIHLGFGSTAGAAPLTPGGELSDQG